ncbi:MAG: hypothetical protein JXA21_04920 [Anaerolineae bacterium]|nr:hypothetical protein [Anaerolineae bacterium]
MEPQIFKFSEKAIEKKNKAFWVIRLSLLIILPAFVFASPGLSSIGTSIKLGALVFSLIFIEAIMFIEPAIIFAKWRQLEIRIADGAIERSGGKFVERISFADMNGVIFNADKAGQVITVKMKSPSKALTVAGFEEMDRLSQMIEEGVPDKSVIQRKEIPIDWDNPLVTLATALATTLVLIGIQMAGEFLYQTVMALMMGAFGIANLTYRPISRSSGERFKTFETVTGVILVVCSALMLIIQVGIALNGK